MNNRPIINSDTFEKIFEDKEDILADMAAALTRNKKIKFKNKITCNKNNPKKLRYIITMSNDKRIEIKDTYSKDNIVIILKK